MVELLKQKENNPIPFNKQAVIIYAGINGYIDKISLAAIASYEQAVYTKLDTTYTDLSALIIQTRKLTDEVEAQIKVLLKEVSEEFC